MRHTLPQRATRHALIEEGAHALAGSSPVRRGIAVAAVVGGALSVAGAAVAVDRIPFPTDTPPDGLTGIGLAADGEDDPAPASDDSADSADDSLVLDTSALAETVREANEEGRRLAAGRQADGGSDNGSAAARAPRAGSGRTASQFPAELIDTDEWYLTLPTGREGSPDTVEGSELAKYHSEHFRLTEAHDGIVFNAGTDGVTTKNSHYPRSELREMNGSQKASWSNTNGAHVFDVREAFTKLPDGKPEVVGVQIHDAEDDVLQIRLEGKKLMVQYHDGKSEAVLDPNYQLGTPFDTRIVAADGKVTVSYNGAEKAELPLSGSGWYWKVGAYVQANGGKSEGEVTVYKANISHSGGSESSSSGSDDA